MNPNKLLVDRELGLISPQQFKCEFIKAKINYYPTARSDFFSIPMGLSLFTPLTVDFLSDLDPMDFLKLYLNLENIFSPLELSKFRSSVMDNGYLHIKIVTYTASAYEEFDSHMILASLQDYVLFAHIPVQFIHGLYIKNKEFRAECNKFPGIVAYLASSNRNLHYIWNNSIIDEHEPEIIPWPRGCHL